ncbi:hypothetical protein [Mesorhizobium sp. A556]
MWASVTEPQAIIISAVLTIVAAVVGVLLGAKLFGNRVRDLNTALAASNKLVVDHKTKVDTSLADIRSTLLNFESLLSATTSNLGILKGSLEDIADKTEVKGDTPAKEATREQLRDDWDAIRGQIETLAAAQTIDGRTRARYARMDRRKYADLVETLAREKQLGDRPEDFEKAAAIWAKYRNGRSQPSKSDVATMADLRKALVPAVDDDLIR